MEAVRDALIVAVADYRDPKLQSLRAPAADAQALGGVLSDAAIGEFDVELSLDEDEPALTRRLARFFANRLPDDLLLVHFSCHGIKDVSGELYLAAVDTDTDLLAATGIPSRWLNEQIDHCRSKRIVVLLDCCFSGSFPFGVRARAGEQVNVQQHLPGRGRVVITASNAMEYSFEGADVSGAGQPSIFTTAVVEGLATGHADRDGDRRVSVDELYEYVFDRVREMNPNQSPTKLSSLEGPLYVAHSTYERPIEAVALPQELVDLARHPYSRARLGAIDELAAILNSEDPGRGLSARLLLERLVDDDSRTVSERAKEVLHLAGAPAGSLEPAPQEGAPDPTPPQPEPALSPPEPAAGSPHGAVRLGAVRAALAIAIAGAIAVIASLPDGGTNRHNAGFWLPVALMAAGVVGLVVYALRSHRTGPLLGSAAVALCLLGVTFPLSWHTNETGFAFPHDVRFWLGAVGALAAAAGVVFAAWQVIAGDRIRPRRLGPTWSPAARGVLLVPGALIVVASIFLANEWTHPFPVHPVWDNWPGIKRYPSALILLCLVVVVLGAAAIRSQRPRLLTVAAGIACLLLGESIPLIFTGGASGSSWGAGRWLAILGAALTVAGVLLCAAQSGGFAQCDAGA